MDLKIDVFVLGPLQTNCYLLRSAGRCAIVDAGPWPEPLLSFLRKHCASPELVLLTHGHGDHIAGIGELKARYPELKVCCPRGDAAMLLDSSANLSASFGLAITAAAPDVLLTAGQTIRLGESTWQVLDSSGHTPGGVSYYCRQAEVVITGDALFAGGIGRADLPGADQQALLDNIRANLLSLPDQTQVLPGHGPRTTIGQERLTNPFLL